MLSVQLASVNYFYSMSQLEDNVFFTKVYRYPEVLFNLHVLVLFDTSDLKEVCILIFICIIPDLRSFWNFYEWDFSYRVTLREFNEWTMQLGSRGRCKLSGKVQGRTSWKLKSIWNISTPKLANFTLFSDAIFPPKRGSFLNYYQRTNILITLETSLPCKNEAYFKYVVWH